MDNLDHNTSTEAEDFNTIARMLTYIRDSARQLDASALEYCIEMAMKAVSSELKSREETGVSLPDFETTIRLN